MKWTRAGPPAVRTGIDFGSSPIQGIPLGRSGAAMLSLSGRTRRTLSWGRPVGGPPQGGLSEQRRLAEDRAGPGAMERARAPLLPALVRRRAEPRGARRLLRAVPPRDRRPRPPLRRRRRFRSR